MEITEYIVSGALILIPVLNIVGMIVKKIKIIPDEFIPLILLAFGLSGCFGILGLSAASAVQGVLVTGAAVYGNQVIKQLKSVKKE